ncbi:MAG TPA: hypothetical protein VMU16_08945 [Candidatus Binataceae bacterium]|nr:hypothetical protein [Candidatus Binataceae bacterium]
MVTFAQTPLARSAPTLSLNQGSNWKAGNLAIAAIVTYNGSGPSITAPRGWTLIRDDISPTTRQTLYWHVVEPCDPISEVWSFSEPVDSQAVVLLLDKYAAVKAIDASSGNSGGGQILTANSLTTRNDGDLILAFYATDFVGTSPGHDIPPNMTKIVDLEAAPHEYWVVAAYQSGRGRTVDLTCNAAQVFRWVAAQVAIKRAT